MSTSHMLLLNRWLDKVGEDPELKQDLLLLHASNDNTALKERFGACLSFGTGGLRGLLGAGSNRMNIYTVRQATQGFALYLKAQEETRPVAIAHDSRRNSRRFALEAARVLAGNGFSVWLYPRLMPTPCLSFAVRELNCCAGICVTASHNPAEYNGYKAYGADGGQITEEASEYIQTAMTAIDPFEDVLLADLTAEGTHPLIHIIDEEIVESYLCKVLAQRPDKELSAPLSVVYTPLNGAGKECVTRVLQAAGVVDLYLVPEQTEPDGNFPTCPYPNPEDPEALRLGLELCKKVKPDVLLATDPDCDRLGVAVPTSEGYRLLSGNEVGVLLLEYLCRRRKALGTLPENPIAITTVVTTDMVKPIVTRYGVTLRQTLTGFKYIGEQISLLERQEQEDRFIFGFEESCGYLTGTYARDKDGVVAALLVCEMARDYKKRGLTLDDAIDALYQEYGYYGNMLDSRTLPTSALLPGSPSPLTPLRASPPQRIAGQYVVQVQDYLRTEHTGLPTTDMLVFNLADESRIFLRPSGTEPKAKIYLFAKGASRQETQQRLNDLQHGSTALFDIIASQAQ